MLNFVLLYRARAEVLVDGDQHGRTGTIIGVGKRKVRVRFDGSLEVKKFLPADLHVTPAPIRVTTAPVAATPLHAAA